MPKLLTYTVWISPGHIGAKTKIVPEQVVALYDLENHVDIITVDGKSHSVVGLIDKISSDLVATLAQNKKE